MTSPNRYVPDNAYGKNTTAGMQNVTQESVADMMNADVTAMLDQLGLTWLYNLLGGFGNVIQAVVGGINQFIYDLLMGLDAITGGIFNIDDLAQHFKRQTLTFSGTASRVSQLSNQVSTVEETYEDTFDRPDSTDIGLDWFAGGTGQPLVLSDGAVRLDNTAADPGIQWARRATPPGTSGYTIETVVHPGRISHEARTTLFVRATEDITDFVYARLDGKSCAVGRGSSVGDEWTYTDWATNEDKGAAEGAAVEFAASGNTYTLKINGVTAITHTDESGYPADAAHRHYGFTAETKVVNDTPEHSWGLSTFVMRPTGGASVKTAISALDTEMAQLRAEFDQLTIHGNARVFTMNSTYYASPGTVRAEVIMIGAGGGGGPGRWDGVALNRPGGWGGGGGGEVHFTIHGTALFDANGNARAIPMVVGPGGSGTSVNEGTGTKGPDTVFDGIVAYGGNGGGWGGRSSGTTGRGGFGMVEGGTGGGGATPDSLSGYALYGGGGAGGKGGADAQTGFNGGRGGLNPGGSGGPNGGVGANAPAAVSILATGGGGGGGGGYRGKGGNGAFPGGGGGGGGGGGLGQDYGGGGNGAGGVIYIIERAS